MGKALTAAGAGIALASLVTGIWLQFEIPLEGHALPHFTAQVHLSILQEMLIPLALGLLLVAAGRVVAMLGTHTPDQTEPRRSA
jgi:hypothetical protein